MYCVVFFYFLFSTSLAKEWDVSNYPNPTTGQFKECGMTATSHICDPDSVLTDEVRHQLENLLRDFEMITKKDNTAHTACEMEGVNAAMAVMKHVKGNSTETVTQMANEFLQKWKFPRRCQKFIIIVVAVEDQLFWVARDYLVPANEDEFTKIFVQQKSLFEEGEQQKALAKIVIGATELIFLKQGNVKISTGGDSGVTIRRLRPWVLWSLSFFFLLLAICCGSVCYCGPCRRKESCSRRGSEQGLRSDDAEKPIIFGEGYVGGRKSPAPTEQPPPPMKTATATITLHC